VPKRQLVAANGTSSSRTEIKKIYNNRETIRIFSLCRRILSCTKGSGVKCDAGGEKEYEREGGKKPQCGFEEGPTLTNGEVAGHGQTDESRGPTVSSHSSAECGALLFSLGLAYFLAQAGS